MQKKLRSRGDIGAQVGYWMILVIVGFLMTAGIGTFLEPALGWFAGHAAGLMLAVAIELSLARSILAWRRERRLGMLLLVGLFFAISAFANAPTLFSVIRGRSLTTVSFEEQRNAATRDMIIARGQLDSAAAAAARLTGYSKDKAKQEENNGNTCEKETRHIFGERARFRKTDAETFEAIAQSIDALSKRLDAAVTAAQSLKPAVGEALQASLQRLDASAAVAYGIVKDPGLAAIASRLETRVKEDLDLRRDPITGVPFRCPDAMIRDSAKSIAQQIRGLPELKHVRRSPISPT